MAPQCIPCAPEPNSVAPQLQHNTTQAYQLPLTRADVRDEVAIALSKFAEDALRRELDNLRVMMRQTIREATTASLATVKTTSLETASVSEVEDEIVRTDPGAINGGKRKTSGCPQTLRREDLRVVLDEWWASHKHPFTQSGFDVDKPGRQFSEDCQRFQKRVQRQQSGSTSGGNQSNSESNSGNSNSNTLSDGVDIESPPLTPFALPPPISTECSPIRRSVPSCPVAPGSVLGRPRSMTTSSLSAPATPMMTSVSAPNGRRDWRRNFVEKAVKANRKIEFLDGSQCREIAEVNVTIEEAIGALEDGIKPKLVEDGLGGTYFMKDRDGNIVAVFKPRDEEPLAPNNPKTHAGEGQRFGLKDGVLVGEAAVNEYAAFLLDQMSGPKLNAGVCPTALVRVANSVFHSAKEGRHSLFRAVKDKVGSFQKFAPHDCTSEDLGPSMFPDDQVHRIAVLDIRLCNTDRHSGNILVRQSSGSVNLIPIDHGYALPGETGGAYFDWLTWPAAKRQFSETLRASILAIDPGSVEFIFSRKIPALRDECLSTLRICTVLLQCGVEAGLTAFDIGSMMVRPESFEEGSGDIEGGQRSEKIPKPSILEELIAEARQEAKLNLNTDMFHQLLARILRAKCFNMAEGIEGIKHTTP